MDTQKANTQQDAWVAPQLNVMSVRETYTGSIRIPEEAIGQDSGRDLGIAGPS